MTSCHCWSHVITRSNACTWFLLEILFSYRLLFFCFFLSRISPKSGEYQQKKEIYHMNLPGTFVISSEAWSGPKGWQLSRKEILEENITFLSDRQSLCIQLFVFTQFPHQILQDPVHLNCPRGGSRGRMQGVPASPPPRWSATFLFNKHSAVFVFIICQRCHSLVVHPLLKKTLDPPLCLLALSEV